MSSQGWAERAAPFHVHLVQVTDTCPGSFRLSAAAAALKDTAFSFLPFYRGFKALDRKLENKSLYTD